MSPVMRPEKRYETVIFLLFPLDGAKIIGPVRFVEMSVVI